METRNAHQILEAVRNGENYTLIGQLTGRPFILSWTGKSYKTVPKHIKFSKEKQGIKVGITKALTMIEFTLSKQKEEQK